MEFEKLIEYLDKVVSEYNTPGVDCIVYKDHQKIFRYFTGKSDIENNKAMCGNELFIIFSLTKMLTCTCALQLIEQGKLGLDDPIADYLPEFENMKVVADEVVDNNADSIATGKVFGASEECKASVWAKNKILVKHLLTMTAGFDYDFQSDSIKKALAEGKTSTRDLVRAMSEKTLCFEPGTGYKYSLCHDVLGALIEVVSGKSLGEYMKENLFDPLGMKETFFGVPEDSERLSRMAARYAYDEERKPRRMALECPYNLSKDYESGGAGIISCTEDYALFLDALANGGVGKSGNRILKNSTIEMMRTNHLTEKQMKDFGTTRLGYGYGLGVRTHIDKLDSRSKSPLGEFGWDGAAGAYSMVDPDHKLSLTYFQQIHEWDLYRLHNDLRNILYECLNID